MKKFSDYKGEEAFDLWIDLFEPIGRIFANPEVKKSFGTKNKAFVAKGILQNCKSDISEVLLRIDDTPINGANIIVRIIELLSDIETDESTKDFFGFAEQEKKENASYGSVMENTEDVER